MGRVFLVNQIVKVIDVDEPYFKGKYRDIQTHAGQTGKIVSRVTSEAGDMPNPPYEPLVKDEYYIVEMEDGRRIKLPPEALTCE